MSHSRRAALFAAVASAGLLISLGRAWADETLADAITLTYETNPTLQAQRASQRALDESYVQARSGLRPSASVSASIGVSNTSPSAIDQPISSSSASITVNQPIYTGGRVVTQITAAEADVLAGREGLRRVEQTVLQSVITAYVDVRRDQQRLAIAEENVTVLERQRREAQARFDVGEITRTDVAQAEARLAAAQASRASAMSLLAISRANYASIVGQNPGDLAAEPPLANLLPATIDQAFDLAQRNNPLVRQADYVEQGSAARLASTRSLARPTLSARASLGASAGGNSPFVDESTTLSASLNATIPLFTGGLTSSQIRAAAERNNVDRIGVEQARRNALLAVSQAWNALLGARANLVANEEQVRAAGIAFEGTRQEAQVGLRTTLDVLNAEQELRQAELALVNARHDEYVASAGVLAAIGALNIRTVVPNAQIYDPATNFEDVSGRNALPWDGAVESIDRLGAPEVRTRPPATPTPPMPR